MRAYNWHNATPRPQAETAQMLVATIALSSKGESIVIVATASPLLDWENFYVIVGSSAGALTGLMFVVITLIASRGERRSSGGVAAFGTPTVFHFCVALLVAAILSAPWPALSTAALLLGLTGLWGAGYIVIVMRRARRQTDYKPVLEDWLWHTICPLASYAALVIAAIVLPDNPTPALFMIGAATVLLLFVGIHNSWDSVTYFVLEHQEQESKTRH